MLGTSNFFFARFTESDWLKIFKRLSEKIKILRNSYFSVLPDSSFIFIERTSKFELIVFEPTDSRTNSFFK